LKLTIDSSKFDSYNKSDVGFGENIINLNRSDFGYKYDSKQCGDCSKYFGGKHSYFPLKIFDFLGTDAGFKYDSFVDSLKNTSSNLIDLFVVLLKKKYIRDSLMYFFENDYKKIFLHPKIEGKQYLYWLANIDSPELNNEKYLKSVGYSLKEVQNFNIRLVKSHFIFENQSVDDCDNEFYTQNYNENFGFIKVAFVYDSDLNCDFVATEYSNFFEPKVTFGQTTFIKTVLDEIKIMQISVPIVPSNDVFDKIKQQPASDEKLRFDVHFGDKNDVMKFNIDKSQNYKIVLKNIFETDNMLIGFGSEHPISMIHKYVKKRNQNGSFASKIVFV